MTAKTPKVSAECNLVLESNSQANFQIDTFGNQKYVQAMEN